MSVAMQAASARLALSREQLRRSLQATANAAHAASGPDARPRSRDWIEQLAALPGNAATAGGLSASSPLIGMVALAAKGAVNDALKPIAQRHPWALVGGALAVGGLVAWSRPWRGTGSALWAGLLPPLLLATLRATAPAQANRPHGH